jgi:hypothetical protein
MAVEFSRVWAMPTPETFSLPPVAALLQRWLPPGEIVDPFARHSRVGTIRNDLDLSADTDYHMHAEGFCDALIAKGVQADAVLFDPPYSPRQITESYRSIGRDCTKRDTQSARLYKAVKDGLDHLLRPGGIAICCGWNTAGFGVTRGYALLEVLLVPHGAAHNDTIITVERKGARHAQ